jgi:hypothetical protein
MTNEASCRYSAQPWIDNPYRLVSLFEMLNFDGDDYFFAGWSLKGLDHLLSKTEGMDGEKGCRELIKLTGMQVSKHLTNIRMETLAGSAKRLADASETISREAFHARVDELVICIQLELARNLFFWVPPERTKYYKAIEELFSERMSNAFPSAVSEIREAGRCLAFDVPTAAVFHLMRAVEYVVKAAWKTLGLVEPKRTESWGALLGPMDDQLQKPPRNTNALWSTNIQFFSELVMDLRAAKRGCRDTTMHVESSYDLKEAIPIFDATLTLLAHAASHLDQDGNFT